MSKSSGIPSVVDPVMRPGRGPSAKRLADNERLLRGTKGIGGTMVRLRPWGLEIGGGSGLDLSKFAFGFTLAGAIVTVKAGDWCVGTGPDVSIDDTPVTISQDHQYIGLEFDPAGRTLSVIGPSTDKAFFQPDETKWRTWLHQFRFKAGRVSFERTHLGSIQMAGRFGA